MKKYCVELSVILNDKSWINKLAFNAIAVIIHYLYNYKTSEYIFVNDYSVTCTLIQIH